MKGFSRGLPCSSCHIWKGNLRNATVNILSIAVSTSDASV